jgi:hypothetical protein
MLLQSSDIYHKEFVRLPYLLLICALCRARRDAGLPGVHGRGAHRVAEQPAAAAVPAQVEVPLLLAHPRGVVLHHGW